jgi:glycosyltransferase involved in cell wall biosynthesis
MRLFFVTNSRLPTERANGYMIMKTCEGLAQTGNTVELWHADRRQADPRLRGADLHDHYAMPHTFVARKLRSPDLMRFEHAVGARLAPMLVSIQYTIWAISAAWQARRSRPDACYTIDTSVALAMTALGVPVVYEHHHPKRRRLAKWSLRAVGRARRNPAIVTMSDALRDEVVGYGVPAAKVRVVRHAVDGGLYAGTPDRAECRRQLGLPLDRLIVGYTGRFQALGMEKGLTDLIKAVGKVGDRGGASALLVCVGGPLDLEAEYRELGRRAGLLDVQLQFVDRVPNHDVPRWIRSFDVATIPFPDNDHYRTVSPLKLVEYLATGSCVLATDLPSLREEVVHSESAWLVPPGPAGLADGLIRLLRDSALRKRLEANAVVSAATRTWTVRGAAISDIVRDHRALRRYAI